jgi:hypothetical protein
MEEEERKGTGVPVPVATSWNLPKKLAVSSGGASRLRSSLFVLLSRPSFLSHYSVLLLGVW